MINKFKVWFIGVILLGLLMGPSQTTTFAASNEKYIATYFQNGLLFFKQNGKYGMMDKKGKVAIKPIYDEIYERKGYHEAFPFFVLKGMFAKKR